MNQIRWIIFKHSLIGAIVGYLFLHPTTMLIYHSATLHEHTSIADKIIESVALFLGSYTPPMDRMSIYFTLLGSLLGASSGLYYSTILSKNSILEKQESELKRNIHRIIDGGENNKTEFKTSIRWDENQEKVNKDLEKVAMKAIAGFMNNGGGSLIIGVKDNKELNGIEKDYSTLKHKNRDGFEQYLMQLTSAHLGTNNCCHIQTLFHNINGKDICQVCVETSTQPVYHQDGQNAKFYLRTGNVTNELNIKEAIKYIQSKWKTF